MSANQRDIRLRFTGDAQPVRLTVAELRAQLGADFDKVVAQAKVSSAAISQVGNNAAAEVKRQIADAERAIAASTLSVKQQLAAADSLQRQRSSAILSTMKAMESDVGKSAAQVARNHELTESLIGDSQRSIIQMERSFAAAEAALAKTGQRIALAESEAASLAGQWETLAGVATGPLAIGIGAAVAAILGAGVALMKFVSDTAEAGDELYDLSQKVNFSVETLSALKNAAETSGGDINTISSALVIFNKNLGSTDEEGGKVNATLAKLNVTATDQEGTLRQVFKALYDLRGSYLQNEYAAALFGKASKDVLGVINDTNGDLDGAIQKYRELGTLITTEASVAAQDYKDELAGVRQQIQGLERDIGNQLLPTAQRALTVVSQLLKDNRQDIHNWTAETIEASAALGYLLKPLLDIEAVIARIGVTLSQGPLLQFIKLLNVPNQIRQDFYYQTEQGIADTTAIQALQYLKQLQGKLKELQSGPVEVPEALKYDQKKADETYNASQYAAAAEFIKRREEAEKEAARRRERERKEEERAIEAHERAKLDAYRKTIRTVEDWRKETERKIEEARRDNERLDREARDRQIEASEAVTAAVGREIAAFTDENTHLAEIERTIRRAEILGAIDAQTAAWLRLLAVLNDIEGQVNKIDAAGMPDMVPAGSGPGGKVLTGPWVNPEETDRDLGPPPDFTRHIDAIETYKSFAVEAFGQIEQGYTNMLAAYFAGGEAAEQSFLQVARGVAAGISAQASIQALFEVAQALAMSALAWFTSNPKYAKSAADHYAAAAIFGVVAGVAGAATAALPRRGSAGKAFAANGAGGGTNEDGRPRNERYTYNDAATPASADFGRSREGTVFARVAEKLDALDKRMAARDAQMNRTFSRIQSLPPGHVVTIGAPDAREAIGVAVLSHSASDDSFNDSLARNMRVA